MIDFLAYLAIILLTLFLMGPFVVLIHELGHGIPALIFTKETIVEIYIGTFNDKKHTVKFKIGRLSFYFKYKYNFFKAKGICKMQKPISSFYKSIVFICGGLLLNFITSVLAIFWLYNSDISGLFKYTVMYFVYYSLILILTNIFSKKIKPENGKTYESDGVQLMKILKQRKFIDRLYIANSFVDKKDYESAIIQLRKSVELGNDITIANNSISNLYILLKNYEEAEKIILPKIKNDSANFNDYYNASYIAINKSDFINAVCLLKKAMQIDNENQYVFNSIGYCMIELGNFEEAEIYLSKEFEQELVKPYALNNLGYLKIITGKLDEGFSLIQESLQLDDTNGYAYRNRGIYYFKKGEFNLAKINFDKAYELERDILHLDVWMKEVSLKTA